MKHSLGTISPVSRYYDEPFGWAWSGPSVTASFFSAHPPVARTLPLQPHVSVSSVPSGTRNMEVPDADESYSVTDVSIGSISGLDDS